MSNYKEKAVAVLLVTTMVGSAISLPAPVFANTPASAEQKQANVKQQQEKIDMGSVGKPVKFLGESTITLKNIHLIPVQNGQILYTTFEVANKSSKELDFYPYWIQMQSASGAKFPVSFVDENKGNKVLPSSTQTYSYFALVPNQISASDLVVRLIKWDFSAPSYQRQIYTFKMPEKFLLQDVEKGKRTTVDVTGVPVSLALTSSQLVKGTTKKQVKLKLSIINEGFRPVELPNYEYALQSEDGYIFPMTSSRTEDKLRMMPKLETGVDLQVDIPVEADISKLSLVVLEPAKEDLNYAFSVPISSFALGLDEQTGTGGTPKGEKQVLDIAGERVSTSVTDVLLVAEGTNKNNSRVLRLGVNFENQGLNTIKLPAYEYSLRGSNGYTYPVTVRASEAEQEILPRLQKTIELNVELPMEEELEEFELVISEPKEEGSSQLGFALASFELDMENILLEFTEIGRPKQLTINGHEYEVVMQNIHVYPSTSSFDNIFSYELKVKNPNRYTVPLPQLGAKLDFLGQQTVPVTTVEQESKSLYSNQETSIYMWGKVPDEVSIRSLIVHLHSMESVGENQQVEGGDLALYNILSRNIRLPEVEFDKTYQSSQLGRNSTMKLHRTRKYDVSGSDIIVTTMLVENKDNRPIKVPSFQGYYQTKDGDIYPAYLQNKEQLISPRSSALVTYWTEMDKKVDLKDMNLVLGQPLEEKSEVMTDAVSFKVTKANQGISNPGAPTYASDSIFSHTIGSVHFTIGKMKPDTNGENRIQFEFARSYTSSMIDDGSEKTITFEVRNHEDVVVHTESHSVDGDGGLRNGINYINYTPYGGNIVRVYENFEKGRREIANFSLDD